MIGEFDKIYLVNFFLTVIIIPIFIKNIFKLPLSNIKFDSIIPLITSNFTVFTITWMFDKPT